MKPPQLPACCPTVEALTRCCAPASEQKVPPAVAVELAALFKSLADPSRIEMLGLLAKAPPEGLCVADFQARFALSQATISHHLRTLRRVGLVDCRKEGTYCWYFLQRSTLDALGDLPRRLLAP